MARVSKEAYGKYIKSVREEKKISRAELARRLTIVEEQTTIAKEYIEDSAYLVRFMVDGVVYQGMMMGYMPINKFSECEEIGSISSCLSEKAIPANDMEITSSLFEEGELISNQI